ncbi:MAG TPA: hypothetical protein VIM65_03940 [Cyclobacteriaceae bacterium]
MNSLIEKIRKYFPLGVILVAVACDSSNETNYSKTGLNYYPLHVGNSWTYTVSELKFDTLIQNISSSYQEKFEVVDSFQNLSGEAEFVIHLSTRNNEDAAWTYSQTWSARVSALNEILVQEENVTYLEILLPVSNGLSWKGNKYNTIESTRTNNRIDTYVIKDFPKAYNTFSHSFKVQESDDKNFAYEDVRYSIYAENVGLAYRINKYIEYCDDAVCFGLNIRNHEVTKIETLVEYEVQ